MKSVVRHAQEVYESPRVPFAMSRVDSVPITFVAAK